MAKMASEVCKISGTRHATELVSMKENPRSIQRETAIPTDTNRPSVTTWDPRCDDPEISDCHTGTVAVVAPVPSPCTNLATMNWPKEYEDDMRIEPIITNADAMNMTFRRPSMSPTKMVDNAPSMPPTVNNATTVPDKPPRVSTSLEKTWFMCIP